jgi:hypothetical protein
MTYAIREWEVIRDWTRTNPIILRLRLIVQHPRSTARRPT